MTAIDWGAVAAAAVALAGSLTAYIRVRTAEASAKSAADQCARITTSIPQHDQTVRDDDKV